MNKSELVQAIADSADLTKVDAGRALDALLETVTGALEKGDSVSLVGFGTFGVKERAARTGRTGSHRVCGAPGSSWDRLLATRIPRMRCVRHDAGPSIAATPAGGASVHRA